MQTGIVGLFMNQPFPAFDRSSLLSEDPVISSQEEQAAGLPLSCSRAAVRFNSRRRTGHASNRSASIKCILDMGLCIPVMGAGAAILYHRAMPVPESILALFGPVFRHPFRPRCEFAVLPRDCFNLQMNRTQVP